jgi:23S rRNA pseudouridine955/2504/2580 synthase
VNVPATLPLGPGVVVLAQHACGLLALGKPEGVLSHPNAPGESPRALLVADYSEEHQSYTLPRRADEKPRRVWLLHRLDSATSGVILVATVESVARAVRDAFETRSVRKRYVAVVLGHPRENRALWRDHMQVRAEGGSLRAAGRGGLAAESAMRLLRLVPGPPALAAIELEPLTGRTHQLRFQCSRRQLPILGDQNYGNFRLNRELARRFGTDRLFLHARHVACECALPSGARLRFEAEAPLPKEFTPFVATSPKRR